MINIANLNSQNFARLVKGGKSLVYVYLREKDGTPYYVGVASTSDRPASKYHVIKPPRNRALIRVLRSGLSRSQAWLWERYFIVKYGRKDTGTGILRNHSDGGEGNNGYRHTEASKRRLSEVAKGRKQTPEWVERRVSKIRGKNNGMYGRRHTEETRKKMSLERTGKKRAPMAEETKRKLSDAKKGQPIPWLDKPKSIEQLQKQSHSLRAFHKACQEQRAAERGVTVPELLKLEKKERNQRSYANWKAKQAELQQVNAEAA